MRIDSLIQGNNQTIDNMNTIKSHEKSARIADETFGYTLDISSKDKDITAYGMGELESFEDICNKAAIKDVSLESDAYAVMSNSMSEEDFAEFLKEGYDPSNMEIDEVVTNLDKIKATLVESGVIVEGYTDDLPDSVIEEIAGSEYADVIKDALRENLLPVDEENTSTIKEVIDLSKEVSVPTDDAKKYMLTNGLNVSVMNLYKAEFSSGVEIERNVSADFEELRPQIENIIENADLPVNDETLTSAKWLLAKNVPVTEENLISLSKLNDVSFPLDEKQVALSSAKAIYEGIDPKYADLSDTESIVIKAVNIKNEVNDYINSLPKDSVKDMRVLEETRLYMTTEANIHLLKKGITIDTKNLEELVEHLKEAEKEIYTPLVKDENSDVELSDEEIDNRIDIFRKTSTLVSEIKELPLETTVRVAFNAERFSLNAVNDEGQKIKADYKKAEMSYESIMTAPRADLGDSIKKAFRNVTDILDDLEITANEINEKAVRSLGYAGIEITEENIEKAAKANTAIENVISLMNPEKTLKLIREGKNPLDEDIYELEKELSEEPIEVTNEKYSEFVWNLEKNGEINQDEKAAFIGLYRLFRKIEKSDGRLTGDVLKSDEKLTLSNLLAASRSDKASGMDVKIDENFGALEKLVTYGKSITDQIMQGFKNTSSDNEYVKEQFEDFRDAMNREESIMKVLESIDEPVTSNNVLAMDNLMNVRGSFFEKLINKADKNDEKKSKKLKDSLEKLHDSFTSKENADEAYSEMAEAMSESSSDLLNESENTVDIKEMKLVNKQISVAASMVRNNRYEVPVNIDGEWTSINLTIVKNSDESGKVTATFDTKNFGKVSADFRVSDNKVSGFIVSAENKGSDAMKTKENELKNEINKTGLQLDTIYYSKKADININSGYEDRNDSVPTSDLYNLAKAFIKVMQE